MTRRDVMAEMAAIKAAIDEGDDEPVGFDVGPFAPTGEVSPQRWVWLAAAAVIGACTLALLSPGAGRAVLSYLAGLTAAVAAFEFGAFNIRVVDRYAPNLTLAAAMFSYVLTALAFALILAASSPGVVDPAGVAVGLGAGLCVWLSALLLASRVRKGTY